MDHGSRRHCIHDKCPGTDKCERRDQKGLCVFEYNPEQYDKASRWTGDSWPPPRRWNAGGTIVYRTYADYCD